MKGHIRERSPGRWAIILDQNDPATGKRKRKWHSFQGTKRQAQVECARLISATQGGTYLEPNKTTFAAYLDHWLDHVKSQVSPRTHERYCEIVRKNIVPALGAVHPERSCGQHRFQQPIARRSLAAAGTARAVLAPTTVVYMHRLIKQALGQAVRWELLSRNAADAVDPPKVERAVMSDVRHDADRGIARGAARYALRMPVMLGVMCGLRRGEISGAAMAQHRP